MSADTIFMVFLEKREHLRFFIYVIVFSLIVSPIKMFLKKSKSYIQSFLCLFHPRQTHAVTIKQA